MKKLSCLIILLLLAGAACAGIDGGANWNSTALPTSEIYLNGGSDGNIYAFHVKDNQLLFSKSKNDNLLFEDFKSIYSFGDTPETVSIGFKNGVIYLYYLINKDIYCSYSSDQGRSFTSAQILNGGLPVKQFAAAKSGDCVSFLSGKSLYYMSLDKNWSNPKEIYITDNKIDDVKIQKDNIFII